MQLSHESSPDTIFLRHIVLRRRESPIAFLSGFQQRRNFGVPCLFYWSKIFTLDDRPCCFTMVMRCFLCDIQSRQRPRFGRYSARGGWGYDPGWDIVVIVWNGVWYNDSIIMA